MGGGKEEEVIFEVHVIHQQLEKQKSIQSRPPVIIIDEL